MEIFVNDKKIDIEIEIDKKNIIKTLEKLEEKLIKYDEVIIEVLLDGKKLQTEEVELQKKYKSIKIKTCSKKKIIIEAICTLESKVDKFHKTLDELIDVEMDLMLKLVEIVGFINWMHDILIMMQEVTAIGFVDPNFNEYVDEFQVSADYIYKSFKKGKIDEILDMIEDGIEPVIGIIMMNSKQYLKEIIKEESKKDILN